MSLFISSTQGAMVKVSNAKCKRPKFSDHRGRTWDTGKIWIDGEMITVHLDTTWGEYLYFQWKGSWHKLKMQGSVHKTWKGIQYYDVDPFTKSAAQLVTETKYPW